MRNGTHKGVEMKTVPKDYWTLSRPQYIKLVAGFCTHLEKELIEKFDRAVKKGKSADINLFTRDFDEERMEEAYDFINYTLFRNEKRSRFDALKREP